MHEALSSPIFNCYKEGVVRTATNSYVCGGPITNLSSVSVSSFNSSNSLNVFQSKNSVTSYLSSKQIPIKEKKNENENEINDNSSPFPMVSDMCGGKDVYETSYMYYHKPTSSRDAMGGEKLPLL